MIGFTQQYIYYHNAVCSKKTFFYRSVLTDLFSAAVVQLTDHLSSYLFDGFLMTSVFNQLYVVQRSRVDYVTRMLGQVGTSLLILMASTKP
jgi:hypothetical protein